MVSAFAASAAQRLLLRRLTRSPAVIAVAADHEGILVVGRGEVLRECLLDCGAAGWRREIWRRGRQPGALEKTVHRIAPQRLPEDQTVPVLFVGRRDDQLARRTRRMK